MDNLLNDIENMLLEIEKTTELFYQQKNKEGYLKLDNTLTQLIKVVEKVSILSERKELEINLDEINQILSASMKALEERDTVLFSDIMQYELVEIFIDIIKKIA